MRFMFLREEDTINRFRNALGAFADGAILFPLIVALSSGSGFSSSLLFLSAGVVYIFSGFFFRIPMPVQPLKAIAIAAIASNASPLEVRWAGALLGMACIALWVSKVDKWVDRIPRYFVQGIQAGLGLLLLRRALDIFVSVFPSVSVKWVNQEMLLVIAALLICLVIGRFAGLSFLGLLAAGGTLFSIAKSPSQAPIASALTFLRWDFVLALVLPQLVLTSANSVIATRDVAQTYFGPRAKRITISRLLCSIGLGNLLVALVGGMPFCHGSGGMTAHVRGGSSHWGSNLVIGIFLVVLAFAQVFLGRMELSYPPLLLAMLLAVVGFYHMRLAQPSFARAECRPVLIVMGTVVVLSQNLLYAVVAGAVFSLASMVLFGRRAVA